MAKYSLGRTGMSVTSDAVDLVTGLTIAGTGTTGITLSATLTTGLLFSGTISVPFSITGTWGVGIAGASMSAGTYSTPVAFGAVSDHIIGIVNHVSASFDDTSNAIPILGKFTTTADSDALPVAQCVLGQGVVSFNFGDVYGVRGSIGISGTPVVNQMYGVNSTIALSTTASIAATGAIALYGGVFTGAVDLTAVSGTPPVAGMYLSWQATSITTLETFGVLVNIGLAAANLDYGMQVHSNMASATVGTSFASVQDASGAITTAFAATGTHVTGLSIATCTGHSITITGTWGSGILGAAINIGDYSNALAFGAISEHAIGIVSHLSADFDDASNAIPILGKFTLEGDSDSAIAQCVLGQGVCNYNIADMYGVRGSIAISGAPEVNQIYSVFATMTTTLCNMAATGMIALYGGVISGTADITKTSGYASVCGMYLSWEETNAMTVDTNGILLNIASGSRIDSGVVVHLDGAGTSIGSSFKSYRDGGTITTALDIEGAHTNAFAFPVAGTAPTTTAATAMNGLTSEGYVTVLVGGAAKKMYYFA